MRDETWESKAAESLRIAARVRAARREVAA
jgi:hypothetical protein